MHRRAVGEDALAHDVARVVDRAPCGKPGVEVGVAHSGPVGLGGGVLTGRASRIHEGEVLLWVAADHDPGDAIDRAGRHIVAFDDDRLDQLGVGAGHGDAGETNDARAVPGLLDGHAFVRSRGEAAIEPGGTDNEDLVAGQEHLGLVRLREFDRGELGAGLGVDHGEPVGGEHIDPFTVGLDDVGLVDTEFLHIGAGEVDSLGRAGRVVAVERNAPSAFLGGGEVGGIGSHIVDRHLLDLDATTPAWSAVPAAGIEAVRADPLGRLGTKVREQGVAVGEAGEAGGQDDLVAIDVDNDLTVVVALDRRIGVGVASVRGTVVAAGGGQQGAAEEEKQKSAHDHLRFAGVLVMF